MASKMCDPCCGGSGDDPYCKHCGACSNNFVRAGKKTLCNICGSHVNPETGEVENK